MSQADTAEYQLEELVKALNKLRKAIRPQETGESFRIGYLAALDDVADQMGITVEKVYKR